MSLILSMSIGVLLIIITLIYGYIKVLREVKTDSHELYILITKSFSRRIECPKIFLTEAKALSEFNKLIINFYTKGYIIKDWHIKGMYEKSELCYKSIETPEGEIDVALFKITL